MPRAAALRTARWSQYRSGTFLEGPQIDFVGHAQPFIAEKEYAKSAGFIDRKVWQDRSAAAYVCQSLAVGAHIGGYQQ